MQNWLHLLIRLVISSLAISLISIQGCKTKETKNFNSIKIGSQVWMKENLTVERFRNGDIIQEAVTTESWLKAGSEKRPAWSYFCNDTGMGKRFGKLYNWYVVTDPRGLAPAGWHIPSKTEFELLKSTARFSKDNIMADGKNLTGFSAVIAGARYYHANFSWFGKSTYFWSTTEYDAGLAYGMYLNYSLDSIFLNDTYKKCGCYIRCVKDRIIEMR